MLRVRVRATCDSSAPRRLVSTSATVRRMASARSVSGAMAAPSSRAKPSYTAYTEAPSPAQSTTSAVLSKWYSAWIGEAAMFSASTRCSWKRVLAACSRSAADTPGGSLSSTDTSEGSTSSCSKAAASCDAHAAWSVKRTPGIVTSGPSLS